MGVQPAVFDKMVQRLTYRRRHSYATKSNGVRKLKTPGGKLTLHNVSKKYSAPKCGDCHCALQGIPVLKPCLYSRLAKNKKNVSRAYAAHAVQSVCVSVSFVP